MDGIDLRFRGFEPNDQLRASAEAGLKTFRSRVPDARGEISFSKLWLSMRVAADIETNERRYAVTLEADETLIVARVFTFLRRVSRLARWERQGVERSCGFCDGCRFVWVPCVHQDTESSGGRPLQIVYPASRGEMDALVCAECGHVEWFVSNPDELPIGRHGTVEVHHRPGTPYRD